MKKFLALVTSLVMLLGMTAAFAEDAATDAAEETPAVSYHRDYKYDFVWSTKGISKLKSKAAQTHGTVETLTYQTPAYAVNAVMGTDYMLEKSVNVYLPAGYDPEKSYNILYLMHGGGDDENYWLMELSDRTHGKTTMRVLDHMIEDGLCAPLIVVTPTFYADVEGVEPTKEQIDAVCAQIGEPHYNSLTGLYTWYFGDEFRNNIIPAVGSKYLTYANKDVSEENLIATRDHRAYCGLSMGSMTSFHGILMRNFDVIGWCGSWSGSLTDEALFRTTLEEKYADYTMNFWYNGNGVDDIAFEEHYELYNQLMESMSDKFVDGENSAMVVLEDGAHNYAAWIVDLYNCLLVFFK